MGRKIRRGRRSIGSGTTGERRGRPTNNVKNAKTAKPRRPRQINKSVRISKKYCGQQMGK